MRVIFFFLSSVLLSVSMGSQAADVEYQHPDLTIVAKEEPLQSVLKSVGKEMRIFITTPTGINPLVSCDIQEQPVKQAFKTLLGDMSYSLEWEEKTGKLMGLTILAGGEGVAAVPDRPSQTRSVEQTAPVAAASGGNQAAPKPVEQSAHDAPTAPDDTARADHEDRMETEQAEHEARMETERQAQEAEMAQRRQEEEVAHEVRMKEEVERHDAEAAAYLESQGLQPPP
jgi:hypothetical protein